MSLQTVSKDSQPKSSGCCDLQWQIIPDPGTSDWKGSAANGGTAGL